MLFDEGDVGLRVVQKPLFTTTRFQNVPVVEADVPAGGNDPFEIHAVSKRPEIVIKRSIPKPNVLLRFPDASTRRGSSRWLP